MELDDDDDFQDVFKPSFDFTQYLETTQHEEKIVSPNEINQELVQDATVSDNQSERGERDEPE
jgi:hypothetical protein